MKRKVNVVHFRSCSLPKDEPFIEMKSYSLEYENLVHKPRQTASVEEPCEKTFCAWGAQCINGPDGKALCQCPTYCKPKVDLVCGTDGKTYTNQCELRLASCKARLNTRVKYAGSCEQSDPCRDKECSFGSRCMINPDGRNATCACPEKCPNYGDHTTSRSVCGSDGVNYRNQCELQRAACSSQTNITIKFYGKCDPCAGVQCTEPEVCQLDEHRNPLCRCGDPCALEFTPVCGSDGKTYSNECILRQEACRSRKPLNIIYRGKCSSGINPCMSVRCNQGEECIINKFGIAHCECPDRCEPIMRPVCSKDGRTYTSECELRKAACVTQANIEIAYTGICGKNGPCSEHECQFGGTCVEKVGTAHCECPACPAEFEPICGSDGISYSNECKLRLEACKHRRNISVLYKGPCNGCESKKCDFYSECESDGTAEGRCVCPKSCSDPKWNNGTVCGTDGITYASECELRLASCRTMQFIILAYKGNCDLCQGVECKYGGKCEAGECVCPTDCEDAGEEPVCASDMITYRNECELQKVRCSRGPLAVIFYGDCRERFPSAANTLSRMEVKPCKGEKPLTDSITERELDCGNGPFRQDCPVGSYCHQTAKFAKCCRKSEAVVEKKGCGESWFGCCPDGKTTAQGPNFGGCPSICDCNKLGSYSDTCDVETQQCRCRPGVGGGKCDRCEPGFWGLPKISAGYRGCIPCGCSTFGSVRDDCEQMTGRCVCKPGVQGQKCTICTNHNKYLGPNGCVSASDLASSSNPSTCAERSCYFGATCVEKDGLSLCECHLNCSNVKETQIVCGSDGKTYGSICDLRLAACRLQKDIVLKAFGSCNEEIQSTDWPYSGVNSQQFTQSDEISSPLSKSTRHLLVPDPRYYYERSSNVRPVSFPDTDFIGSNPGSNILYRYRGNEFSPAYRPTPATVQVLTALLGDLCSDNTDCIISNSHCVKGACICFPSYVESTDRQECLANSDNLDEFRACSSLPCNNDGTCIDLPASTYACVCTTNFTGLLCETEISQIQYEVPAFHGKSYARLRPLKAYHKLSIEVEFQSYTDTGILLYNQQKADGMGDFVSLAIINSYLEFKYNLGNGAVVIRSVDKIQIGNTHRVIIKRYHRDGLLKLDDSEEITGQSSGSLKALDLLEDAFIGYVPTNHTRVYENIGTSKGFQGCIKRFKIGRQDVEIHIRQEDWILEVNGVYDCSKHACKMLPCENHGKCIKLDRLFKCECQASYSGEFCENSCLEGKCHFKTECNHGNYGTSCQEEFKSLRGLTPEFNGNSFIQLPRLEGIKKRFSIEVTFMTTASSGLILYNGQMKNGRGDFISLNIARGYLQFRFNLGSGIANLTSSTSISFNKWYKIRISREGREGMLQIDNSTVIRGYSGIPLTELNLDTPLYIGSLPNWKQIHRLSGASKGFKGVIQRITFNGLPLPISKLFPDCGTVISNNNSSCSSNIGFYDGAPCPMVENPCFNNGICIPNMDNYTCRCTGNYKGKYCETINEETLSLKFNGATYLQYRNRGYKRRKPERGNRYELKIRTFMSDGLILWRSKNRNQLQNYISIAVVDGYPELSFNLGHDEPFWAIRSRTKIDDGQWHSIQVRRRKRMGFISVDGYDINKGVAKAGAISLRTNSKLWLGGSSVLPAGLPTSYYKGFDGCIQKVLIHGKPLDLLADNDISKINFCHGNEI